jgi:hypothetical protein
MRRICERFSNKLFAEAHFRRWDRTYSYFVGKRRLKPTLRVG